MEDTAGVSKSPITYHDIMQGTEEWYQARTGIVTASNIKLIMTPTGKVAKNDKVKGYAYEIAAQRETQYIEDTFQSWDMKRGNIQEDIARNIYSDNYALVEECGFITNDTLGFTVGASPDGLVGEDGGIEIKSRNQKFQIQTIANNEVPAEYILQIQATLLISGRKWWDFVQYSNGMRLFVSRVTPDLEMQNRIIEAIVIFEETVKEIQGRYQANSVGLIPCERVEVMQDDEINPSEPE